MGKQWNIEHRDLLRQTHARQRAARRQAANDRLPEDLAEGEFAADQALQFREALRRRTKVGPERDERIDEALDKLAAVMTPLRSARMRAVYDMVPSEHVRRLRQVVRRIQHERESLRRMKS